MLSELEKKDLLEATQFSCWITRIDSWLGNIFGDDTARADDNVFTDADRQDRSAGANGNIVSDFGALPFGGVAAGGTAIGEEVVYEHRAVRNEAVVTNRDQFANECVRLYSRALADCDLALDFNKRAHETVVANFATVQIGGFDDRDVFAKCYFSDADRFEVRLHLLVCRL